MITTIYLINSVMTLDKKIQGTPTPVVAYENYEDAYEDMVKWTNEQNEEASIKWIYSITKILYQYKE